MHLIDLRAYLSELAENNNRAWFVMNKPRYDILRAEFLQFVSDLQQQISRYDGAIAACEAKKAIFRINRDVRFAHDKSPYKTQFSAALNPTNRKKPSEGGGPMYYLQFDGQGKLFFACGEYIPPAERLQQIRQHIVKDSAGFKKVIKDKKMLAAFGGLQSEEKLLRPPKGYDAEHEFIEFIKFKSFLVRQEIDYTKLNSEQALKTLAAAFKDAQVLVQWLRAAS